MIDVNRRVLPGFGLSLGYTMLYLSFMIAVPMAAGVWKASSLSFDDFMRAAFSDRALAAYWLTLWTSFVSAVINVVFGGLVAWVLVRYEFPLKRLFDSLVDFPFALPTAVAGPRLLAACSSRAAGTAASSCRSASRARTRGSASSSSSSSSASRSSSARCSRCSRASSATSRRRRPASAPTRFADLHARDPAVDHCRR